MKRWWIMIGGVLALVILAGGLWGYNLSKKMAAFKAASNVKQTVSAMRAEPQQWRDQLHAVGSLAAVRGADLAPEVAGIVDRIHFNSGADVKAGTTLVELRAGDERAKLDALKAAADLAASVYKRDKAQFAAKAVSQAQLDSDEATLKQARAQVAEQQALVDKKIIRAPFAGRLGIRAVNEGQYLTAGTKVVTLQQLDPIHVEFSLPQQDLARLTVGASVTVSTDLFPDKTFAGKVTAIDPTVSVDTRNVQVQATLRNPDKKLLPGMFAKVAVAVGKPRSYLTLPQTAITYNPYGETVFVVTTADQLNGAAQKQAAANGQDGKALVVRQVFVTTGPTRGDQVAILKGISAGDQVVTSGQLKLHNGTAVQINNTVVPSNDPHPTPHED